VNDISSSEYLYSFHKIKNSPAPHFNIDEEISVQQSIKHLIKNKLIESAHDVSDGGLFITLTESSMPRNLGFAIETDFDTRADAFLFGEAQSRVVVSVSPDKLDAFTEFVANADIEFSNLGMVTEGSLLIDEQSFGSIADAKILYDNAIRKLFQ
jgi:phosphoribosylformylglycinamidine synthase